MSTPAPVEFEERQRGLVNQWLARCRQRRLDREEHRERAIEDGVRIPPGSRMHGSDRTYIVAEDGSWRRVRKIEAADGN